jgi:hypothetical protein
MSAPAVGLRQAACRGAQRTPHGRADRPYSWAYLRTHSWSRMIPDPAGLAPLARAPVAQWIGAKALRLEPVFCKRGLACLAARSGASLRTGNRVPSNYEDDPCVTRARVSQKPPPRVGQPASHRTPCGRIRTPISRTAALSTELRGPKRRVARGHARLRNAANRPASLGWCRIIAGRRPEPTEMGGVKCACCCRRPGRAATSNRRSDSRWL